MLKDDDFERCNGNSLYFRENITCECCKKKMQRNNFRLSYKANDGEMYLTYTNICCKCRKQPRKVMKDVKFTDGPDKNNGGAFIAHLVRQANERF